MSHLTPDDETDSPFEGPKVIMLSARDSEIMLDLLDNSPEPSPELRRLLEDYQRCARCEGERTILDFSLRLPHEPENGSGKNH